MKSGVCAYACMRLTCAALSMQVRIESVGGRGLLQKRMSIRAPKHVETHPCVVFHLYRVVSYCVVSYYVVSCCVFVSFWVSPKSHWMPFYAGESIV